MDNITVSQNIVLEPLDRKIDLIMDILDGVTTNKNITRTIDGEWIIDNYKIKTTSFTGAVQEYLKYIADMDVVSSNAKKYKKMEEMNYDNQFKQV